MSEEAFAKCGCERCGNHIEFPLEVAGASVACPHCGGTTVLCPEQAEPALEAHTVSAAELAAACGPRLEAPPVSLLYKLGLVLVTVMMVLLPVLYLLLIVGAAAGVVYYATHAYGLLSGRGNAFGRLVLYAAPLLTGVCVVLFMIKPLFARRAPGAQPLALNPAVEPCLFAFISSICQAVGAPMPARIDLDCQLNAAASFRRGFASLLSQDLVLTIGLPLAGALSVRELAGVIAHEFGHFTHGFAMRLSYIIRSIDFWFARVVYERDAWDVTLEQWAEEAEDGRAALLIACIRFGIWSSRLVLKLIMYSGHLVSCFLLRQMEYDADSYEIKVAGSDTFEATMRRLHLLGRALERSYEALKASWVQKRQLPDHFPAFLLAQEAQLPRTLRAKLDDTIGLRRTGVFDTHPSDADRIQRARQASEPGRFQLEGPATMLFQNFDALARQVTMLHYTDDLRLPAVPGMVTRAGPGTGHGADLP